MFKRILHTFKTLLIFDGYYSKIRVTYALYCTYIILCALATSKSKILLSTAANDLTTLSCLHL